MVPIPTPAAAAMSRTGASTPEVTNTAAAAASSACWLRRASARCGLRSGTSLRIVGGASFRLSSMPAIMPQEMDQLTPTTRPSFGIATAPQQVSYHELLQVWQEADTIPQIEHAWAFDHLLPIGGDPAGPVFEGWTLLPALAAQTSRLRLGLL